MKTGFLDLAVIPGENGRWDTQHPWCNVIGSKIKNCTMLDVGTGISTTKERMKKFCVEVTTQDLCVGCVADFHKPISEFDSKSYDAVLCLDVIEHVKDYGRFAFDMARIAKQWVFITTPGFGITTNSNPYHWHEFYPDEICQLLEATGMRYEAGYANDWKGEVCGSSFERTREEMRSRTDLHPLGILFTHFVQ